MPFIHALDLGLSIGDTVILKDNFVTESHQHKVGDEAKVIAFNLEGGRPHVGFQSLESPHRFWTYIKDKEDALRNFEIREEKKMDRDGWILHYGGECPVHPPKTIVNIQRRDGVILPELLAEDLVWLYSMRDKREDQIVAYQIVKEEEKEEMKKETNTEAPYAPSITLQSREEWVRKRMEALSFAIWQKLAANQLDSELEEWYDEFDDLMKER